MITSRKLDKGSSSGPCTHKGNYIIALLSLQWMHDNKPLSSKASLCLWSQPEQLFRRNIKKLLTRAAVEEHDHKQSRGGPRSRSRKGGRKHGWTNNNKDHLLPLFMHSCRICLSSSRSIYPHLHPSFVFVISSHQCENTQETFTTMGLFTHLLHSGDSNERRRHVSHGIGRQVSLMDTFPSSDWENSNFVTHTQRACPPCFDKWPYITLSNSIRARMCRETGSGEADVRRQSCFVFTSQGWMWLGGRSTMVWGVRMTGLSLQSAITLLFKSVSVL